MWFACVSIGAVATAVIIVSLWEKFQTNPTITGLDTDFHNWDVPFPAIVVCPRPPYNLSKIHELYESKYSDASLKFNVQLLKYLASLSFDTLPDLNITISNDFSTRNVAFELMSSCEEMFEQCEFKTSKIACCDYFYPVFTEQGFCYSFNSKYYEKVAPWNPEKLPDFTEKFIKETDPSWALKFSVKNQTEEMPIYIVQADERVGLDIQPQHIWDFRVNKISFSVKTTYTTEDTRQLSIKQRHCVFDNEVVLDINGNDKNYTFTACTQQCRMENSMKLCKCIPHFYPEIKHYKHCKMQQFKCLLDNIKSIRSVEHCSCYLGCVNTVYEVEKLNEATDDMFTNEIEISFVSWPIVRYKREVLFGWVDLLVSFGGIAGLFLGFSLLSGVEIIYYFTIRAFCMVVKEKNELEKIRYEEESKPPQDYDLSLKPNCCNTYKRNGLNQVARDFYKYNLNNKLAMDKALNKSKKIRPPFGIEFIN